MGKTKKTFAWMSSALSLILGLTVALGSVLGLIAHAQTNTNGFALSVSPSPLVETVKPGVPKDVELKVSNIGKSIEHLKLELREFSVDKTTGDIKLKDSVPKNIPDWVQFGDPQFTVEAGKTATQSVHISLPKDSGFSYSFAILVSRASGDAVQGEDGNAIHGSIAVFALVNVDRPGAVRKFEVSEFKPSMPVFEYLPADFNAMFQNTGNTIVQPFGNVFIQRGSDDSKPIATLPLNDQKGYMLPNSPRQFKTSWKEGFPVFKTTTDSAGKQKSDLAWDWSKLADFRFGQYTAKMIAIYNDGQRDVPVMRETTFWVIPWRAILVLIAIIAIVLLLLRRVIHKRTHHAVKKALADKDKK
jgi:hypothetical protein